MCVLFVTFLSTNAASQPAAGIGRTIVDIQYSHPEILHPADLERAQPLKKGAILRLEDASDAIDQLFATGRFEDIALYCLEDVRATSELYLKLESTLLMFEQAFREAEERARIRREPAMVTSSEVTFLEGVAQSSLALTTALAELEIATSDDDSHVLTAKQQALVLEKLCAEPVEEEEIGNGL